MKMKKIHILILIGVTLSVTLLSWWYFTQESPKESPLSCNKDEDCVITSYTYECCGAPCGGAIINKQEFEKRKQWTVTYCMQADYDKCPSVNCEFVNEKAVCQNSKCIRVVIE